MRTGRSVRCGKECELAKDPSTVLIKSDAEKEGRGSRKVPKSDMWSMIEEVAKMKTVANYVRCRITENRWERGWHRFVTRVWTKESPAWDWDAKEAVYVITVPKSHQEYIGETRCGIFQRWRGHLARALTNGRQQDAEEVEPV